MENKEPVTYLAVGETMGLKGIRLLRYLEYMKTRWPDTEELKCQTGYAWEWAGRFADQVEYECSDEGGKHILRKIDEQYEEKPNG